MSKINIEERFIIPTNHMKEFAPLLYRYAPDNVPNIYDRKRKKDRLIQRMGGMRKTCSRYEECHIQKGTSN